MLSRAFLYSLLILGSLVFSSCAERRGSIGIVSVTPVYGKALEPGVIVSIRTVVSFRLVVRSGAARLIVQKGESSLGSETVSLFGREGFAALETDVTVPQNGEIRARVALYEEGQLQTEVMDGVNFKIAIRENGL
jgi:hypothetical protein